MKHIVQDLCEQEDPEAHHNTEQYTLGTLGHKYPHRTSWMSKKLGCVFEMDEVSLQETQTNRGFTGKCFYLKVGAIQRIYIYSIYRGLKTSFSQFLGGHLAVRIPLYKTLYKQTTQGPRPALLVISGASTGDHNDAHNRNIQHLNVLQNPGDFDEPGTQQSKFFSEALANVFRD